MNRAVARLVRLARKLDALYLASNTGRYERATNSYEAALLDAYTVWVQQLLNALTGETDLTRAGQVIIEQIPSLRMALQDVAQAGLPDAVNAMTDAYVPSADAYRLIADAITQNNADLETRLLPAIEEKLLRAVLDGADLNQTAESMTARVSGYAGSFWVLIQRLIGDFVAQAQTADDAIYPVRWVRTKDDHSCESCIGFEGTYESYNAMLEKTFQCVPGYFFNSPYKSSCWGYCRCHLEIKMNGTWVRV